MSDSNYSDVFYHDPALFATQATIDRHVDMIASAFGVTRADLNVVRSALLDWWTSLMKLDCGRKGSNSWGVDSTSSEWGLDGNYK